jgi:hypothetical protein
VGEKSNVYRVLVGKYERKRLFGSPRFRYDDNIKVNLEVLISKAVDRIRRDQDRETWRVVVNRAVNLRVS